MALALKCVQIVFFNMRYLLYHPFPSESCITYGGGYDLITWYAQNVY